MSPQRGLELAEIREHKFLKSGNRDLMCPLQVRLLTLGLIYGETLLCVLMVRGMKLTFV